jgi:hypothetical protein
VAVKFNPFTGNLDLIDTTAAAGSTTQVQYNSGGSLAGSADLTWDDTGKELVDSTPNMVLTTWPAQHRVHCPSCNYTGTRL